MDKPFVHPVKCLQKHKETHKRWQIILISTKCNQSIRHTLASQTNRGRSRHLSFPPYAVIHDMIATLICPGWFTINLQSQGNRQTESQRERERERGFLFAFCLFCFFKDIMTIHHAFAFRCCRMMFIKGSRFSKHYLSLKLIENMCRNASHSPSTFSAVNNHRKKVSSFSQSLTGVWKPFESKPSDVFFFFYTSLNLLAYTYTETHSQT